MNTKYIVKNKISAYTVVCPSNAKSDETLAANEFCGFINKATGATVPVVSDKEIHLGNDDKYISIGNTSLFDEAGLTVCGEMGTRGFVINTVGNSVFVKGNTDTGTLNGVYRLLNLLIGFEPYGPDTPYYNKDIDGIEFNRYDISEKPDIPYNMVAIGAFKGVGAKRMRFDETDWMLINDGLKIDSGGSKFHTSFHFLPPFIHKEKHPEWYSDDGTQLCFLAHGNEESLKEMYLASLQVLKEHLKNNIVANKVCFTQQDELGWCDCPDCKRVREQYGTDSASIIWFLNKLSAGVKEWFAGEGKPYERPFDICFLAYHNTRIPPVKKDEKGMFSPIDDSVVLADGVSVIFAPIMADFHKSLDDDVNAETRDGVKGWSILSKRMYMWTYSTNFHYYLVPYNSFNAMSAMYRFLSKYNAYFLFNQNQYNHANSTGFTILKGYLSSKLAWDSSLDTNALIDAFFRDYYGIASGYMRQCFDTLLKQFDYMENELKFSGYVFESSYRKDIFPKEFLTECIGLIEKALKQAELIKNHDADGYRELYLRIITESIAFRFLLIQLYSNEYSEKESLALKRAFVEDAKTVNITLMMEKMSIENAYKEWGIL